MRKLFFLVLLALVLAATVYAQSDDPAAQTWIFDGQSQL